MKIIAIMGSPRGRGAGYAIVKMIENRMKAMGSVVFDYIFLREINLKSCTGCYVCMVKGEDKCPLKDDRAAIEQQLLAADGIILSSPVYVNNVSGLMKNFIDRFAYMNHRPSLHRQKMLTVANVGGTEKKETLSALKIALGYARGARVVHQLGIETPPWLQTERSIAEKERAIDTAAQNFYRVCTDTSLPVPTFNSFMDFFIWQKLSFECRQYLPADYAFYNGKTYYYDTKANPVKVATAKVAAGMIMSMYKRKGIGPGSIRWPVAKQETL